MQGIGQLIAVLAAGLCHLRAATAATTNHSGDIAYHLSGIDAALDQVLRDGGDHLRLFIEDGAHHDNAAAETIAQPIGHLAHGIDVWRIDLNCQDCNIVYLNRLVEQALQCSVGPASGVTAKAPFAVPGF